MRGTIFSRGQGSRNAVLGLGMAIVLTLVTATTVAAAAPSNDSLATPRVISFNTISGVSGATNVDATKVGEPTPSCQPNVGATVWWRYRPNVPMSVSLNTSGSSFDTVLAVYRSTENGLVQVACSDDVSGGLTSALSFKGAATTAYYIQIGGYLGANGNISFSYVFKLTNDAFGNAQSIKPGFTAEFNNLLANSNQTNEPAPCGSVGHTVWYKFKASAQRKVSFDTYDSEFDSLITVYRGSSLSNLQFVTCADDTEGTNQNASVSWTAAANVTYYIQVGGFNTAAGITRVNFVRTP
jgi:hypothetical protein